MSEFEDALQAKLARNAELQREREANLRAMEEYEQEKREEEARRQAELVEQRQQRHAELVDALSAAAQSLKSASPESFVVRTGWTESREEFIAKISTRQTEPARSLFIELDRDDDEVLARWHSDIGDKLELWRLLEADTDLIHGLVLQVADQDLWRDRSSPPPFPGQSE